MVFDKVIKYNSCILHSWIKSHESGTLHYCIFIAKSHGCDVSEGCVKLLPESPVHLCTLAAAPFALQTFSMKFLSLILSSSSCLKAEQEWEAVSRPWAHLFSGMYLHFGGRYLTPLDQLTPMHAFNPPNSMAATNQCLALASCRHLVSMVHGLCFKQRSVLGLKTFTPMCAPRAIEKLLGKD